MKSRVVSLSIRSRMLAIVAAVALLVIPEVLPAAPVRLTFDGTVRRVDGNFSVAPYGIIAGTPVSFTYIVDLAVDGHLGSTPAVDTTWYDYFHAEQVGGLRILGGSAVEDTAHRAYRDTYWGQTHIYAGSGREANDWWSSEESLPAGQYFYVGQYFYGNGGLLHPNSPTYSPYAFVRYDLTLTSMSSVVPIPGALWFFAPAMAGLVGLRRRFIR